MEGGRFLYKNGENIRKSLSFLMEECPKICVNFLDTIILKKGSW
jgi:hypothetical protein